MDLICSPDQVGAAEAAQAVQIPEEEEQRDDLRPEAHLGDLEHGGITELGMNE